MRNRFCRTSIAAGVLAVLGGAAVPAAADTVVMSWEGLFTMLTPDGNPLANVNLPYYQDPTWGYGQRTQVSGTLSYNTVTGLGGATVASFEFFSSPWPFAVQEISLVPIGNGQGGSGTLLLGNMLFDWNNNTGTPASIVLDAAGLLTTLGDGYGVTESISGVGSLPASNGLTSNYPYAGYSLAIGPAPLATTTWDTTPLCTRVNLNDCLNINPSGALPLIADSVGGVPMIDGPFAGLSINLDITNLHIDQVLVPIPAAAWLFGSGLLGLIGVSGRRKGVVR